MAGYSSENLINDIHAGSPKQPSNKGLDKEDKEKAELKKVPNDYQVPAFPYTTKDKQKMPSDLEIDGKDLLFYEKLANILIVGLGLKNVHYITTRDLRLYVLSDKTLTKGYADKKLPVLKETFEDPGINDNEKYWENWVARFFIPGQNVHPSDIEVELKDNDDDSFADMLRYVNHFLKLKNKIESFEYDFTDNAKNIHPSLPMAIKIFKDTKPKAYELYKGQPYDDEINTGLTNVVAKGLVDLANKAFGTKIDNKDLIVPKTQANNVIMQNIKNADNVIGGVLGSLLSNGIAAIARMMTEAVVKQGVTTSATYTENSPNNKPLQAVGDDLDTINASLNDPKNADNEDLQKLMDSWKNDNQKALDKRDKKIIDYLTTNAKTGKAFKKIINDAQGNGQTAGGFTLTDLFDAISRKLFYKSNGDNLELFNDWDDKINNALSEQVPAFEEWCNNEMNNRSTDENDKKEYESKESSDPQCELWVRMPVFETKDEEDAWKKQNKCIIPATKVGSNKDESDDTENQVSKTAQNTANQIQQNSNQPNVPNNVKESIKSVANRLKGSLI